MSTPHRILLAVDSLPVGGTERQIVHLVKGLRQSGRYAVVLALLDHGGELEPDAVAAAAAVLPIARKARFDCTPVLTLLWAARRARVRLIHTVGWMSALAGVATARGLGMPIVNASVRSAPRALQLRDRIGRWGALRADAIVANSHAGLRAYGLHDEPRAQVIPNGVDLARFVDVTPDTAGGPTVCMVANFSTRKDQASVIRALPAIRRVAPAARLVLVGKDLGTLEDNRRLARELGIADAVCFVTDCADPARYIAGSHVCVLASPSESFSNAILEYMAAARPVVATDTCGDGALLIRDGNSGFLVPHPAPAMIAARVGELLRDPDRAHCMGEAGRRTVEAFTVARMVSQYESLYDRLLASRHGAWSAAGPCAS